MKKVLILFCILVCIGFVSGCQKIAGQTQESKKNQTPLYTSGTTNALTTTATEEPVMTDVPTTTATEEPHIHSYNSAVAKDATCGDDGIKIFICVCGDTYTEKIIAGGNHTWENATCTRPKTCATCKITQGGEKGHSWGIWVTIKAAEVGQEGQEKRTCSECYQTETRVIQALKEDTTKKWFVNQYNVAKNQYINRLNSYINLIEDEINELEDEAKELYVAHMKVMSTIKESAARQGKNPEVLIRNENDKYSRESKVYNDAIAELEEEVSAIEIEIINPNIDNILMVVVENSNTSSREIYEYYYKYSDSLN